MVVIVTTNLSSQLPGNYQPLEFDDLVPLWTHVTYDSTVVGHEIPNPRSIGIEFDGYSHVFPSMDTEVEPLIFEGFYYKISRTIYDTDVSGGLIEKIDLSNGEIIWKQVFDLRTQDRREFIGRTLIKDDKLILIDLDIITPDHPDVPVPIVAYAGFDTYGILKIREYDLQTGELVCIDVADENDPNVMLIRSAEEYSTRIYMIDDSTFQVIDYKNEYQLDIAPYLLVDTINRQGQYLNSTDTIFSSYQFDADWTDTRRNKSLNVIIDEYTDEIVWFDDYIEGNFNQGDSKGRILKIKNNELKKLEIPDVFSKGSPQGLGLINITQDYYLVAAIIDADTDDWTFYLIDKEDGSIINYFEITGMKSFREPQIGDNGSLIFAQTNLSLEGRPVQFFEKNDSVLELVSEFGLLDSDYLFTPIKIFPLTNGNYLVSGIQTEAPIGAPSHKGIFMTDFLVTPENIGVETVSVNNIVTNEGKFNVFPNPSKSMLNIQSFANKDYNAIIVNSFGQTVKELSIKEQSIISFDINNLISGNYYVYFISNSDVETLPLIIVN
jgi:hypothetical protein